MAEEAESPPISFNRQITTLDVGETVAVSRRIMRNSPEAADLSAIKAKMRNSVNPAVSRARKRHNNEFQTDTGEFLTQDGHVMVVACVTRTG